MNRRSYLWLLLIAGLFFASASLLIGCKSEGRGVPSDGDDQPITTEARHLSVDEAKAIALRFFAENGALKGATDTDQISGIELAFAEPTSSPFHHIQIVLVGQLQLGWILRPVL